MTVTWTSGYSQSVAKPIVSWKSEDDTTWTTTTAVTLTFSKADMCGTYSSPSFNNIYLARVDIHFLIFLHFLSFVLSFGFGGFFFLLYWRTGPPASTIGFRDPGFTHTGFLKNLGPDTKYKSIHPICPFEI
jgi:hypothetical protein